MSLFIILVFLVFWFTFLYIIFRSPFVFPSSSFSPFVILSSNPQAGLSFLFLLRTTVTFSDR